MASSISSKAVHPRTRGEHPVAFLLGVFKNGSSPHARGTPFLIHCDQIKYRFIPARAGNTAAYRLRSCSVSVHPRTRGEHPVGAAQPQSSAGSSPHARGTLLMLSGVRFIDRFIPARAGNTHTRAVKLRKNTVHPRTRGEHKSELGSFVSQSGSSPHARGTQRYRHNRRAKVRFIPARAGNTQWL